MATNTEKLNELSIRQAEMMMMVKNTNEKVDDLSKIIKGNGHPGLVKRVDCVENDLKSHVGQQAKKDEIEQKNENRRFDIGWKIALIFIGAMVSGVIGQIIAGLFK